MPKKKVSKYDVGVHASGAAAVGASATRMAKVARTKADGGAAKSAGKVAREKSAYARDTARRYGKGK